MSEEFVIFVTLKNKKSFDITTLKASSTVRQLQQEIQTCCHVPVTEQKLTFRKQDLNDLDATIESYGITPHSCVVLTEVKREKIHVFVRKSDKTTEEMEIFADDSVNNLKCRIKDELEINLDENKVLYQSIALNDDNVTMQQLNIKDNATFTIQPIQSSKLTASTNGNPFILRRNITEETEVNPTLPSQGSSQYPDNQQHISYKIISPYSRQPPINEVSCEWTLYVCKGNQMIEMKVESKSTVKELKKQISETFNIPVCTQVLSLNDVCLVDDGLQLGEAGMDDYCSINVNVIKGDWTVYVSSGDKIIEYNVHSKSSVSDLKQQISDSIKVPIGSQVLYFNNERLSDSLQLWESGIENFAILTLDVIERKVNVLVRDNDNSRFHKTKVDIDRTLEELRQHISSLFHVDDHGLEIYHKGCLLNDENSTIEKLGIRENSVLSICVKEPLRKNPDVMELPATPSFKNEENIYESIYENVVLPNRTPSHRSSESNYKDKKTSDIKLQLLQLIKQYKSSMKFITSQNVTGIGRIKTQQNQYDMDLPEALQTMIRHVLCCDYVTALQLQSNNSCEQDVYNELDDIDTEVLTDIKFHPVDLLLTIFYVSDDVLRQTLMTKLALCQVALPFILPSLSPEDKYSVNEYSVNEVLLWSFEGIRVAYQIRDQPAVDECITRTPFHSALFVRTGKTRILSKSQLASRLLNDENHPYFLSRQYYSSLEKHLTDGLVDVAWYLPRGEKTLDIYSNTWIALNIHGAMTNSNNLELMNLICQCHVNVVCIFVGEDVQTNDDVNLVMKSLVTMTANVTTIIWICTESNQTDLFKQHLNRDSLMNKKHVLINCSCLGEAAVLNRVKQSLKETFVKSSPEFSFAKLTAICEKSREFVIDSAKSILITPIQLANQLCSSLPGNKSKNDLFPLQNRMISIMEYEKEYRRMIDRNKTTPVDVYQKQILQKLTALKNQFKDCQNNLINCRGNIFETMRSSIYKLKPPDAILPFLNQLGRQLYERNKQSMTDLREELTRLEIGLKTIQQDTSKVEAQNEKILDCRRRMVEKHLGLENFLREFNLLSEDQPDKQEFAELYLNQSIQMLYNGFPLEIMDGYSSNVTLKWLKRIFDKLHAAQECRVCVVAVLGVQSSGKSTMLNMMFGLNFNVSVGRCTRGIYAQLLPLDEDVRKWLGCTHLLLLDTEGLCSPESKHEREHDNELATFVVTLSNITIINIRGENVAEMQEILEIVSLSILRMKRAYAKSDLKLEPCCILVHQNVDAVEASDKLDENRRSVKQCLDQAARAAWKLEGGKESSVNYFSDIIDFDICDPRYVWYIPALWKGNVPMAAVNPLYEAKVAELKENVFRLLKGNNSNFLTLPLFHNHMKDVWHSILQENFVFSFKNCLEANAYQFLLRNYVQWDLQLRDRCHELESMAEEELKRNTGNKDKVINNFRQMLTEEYDKIVRENLNPTFEDVEYKKLLITWRIRYETKFRSLYEERMDEGMKHIRGVLRFQEIIKKFTVQSSQFDAELKKRVKEFVEGNFDSSKLDTPAKRKEVFDNMWSTRIHELKLEHPDDKPKIINIEAQFDEAVTYTFGHGTVVVNEYCTLLDKSSKKRLKLSEIPKMIRNKLYDFLVNPLDFVKKKQVGNEARITEFDTTTLERVETKLIEYQTSNTQFTVKLIESIILPIYESYKRQFSDVPPVCVAAVLVNTRNICIPTFYEMQEKFFHAIDPFIELEQKKTIYWEIFEGKVDALKAVDTFTNALKRCILNATIKYLEEEGSRLLAKHVFTTYRIGFPQTKSELIGHCLYSIGYWTQKERKASKLVTSYARDAMTTLHTFLISKMFEIYETEKFNIQKYFKNMIEKIIDELQTIIDKSLSETWNETVVEISTQEWLTHIVDNCQHTLYCKMISSNMETLLDLTEENVKRAELLATFSTKLTELKDEITFKFSDDMIEMAVKYLVETELMNSCKEKCPFCGAICELGKEHTQLHMVCQHRPTGLMGWNWLKSTKLVTDVCPSLVASDCCFSKSGSEEWHPFKEYSDIFPNWSIPGDSTIGASKYWKWLFAECSEAIAEEYGREQGDIPEDWSSVTWKEAVESLEEDYDVHDLDKNEPIRWRYLD